MAQAAPSFGRVEARHRPGVVQSLRSSVGACAAVYRAGPRGKVIAGGLPWRCGDCAVAVQERQCQPILGDAM